jgi:hypothetical protein
MRFRWGVGLNHRPPPALTPADTNHLKGSQVIHRLSVSPQTPLIHTFLRRRSLLSQEKPNPQIRIPVIVSKLDLREVGGYTQLPQLTSEENSVES